MSEADAGLLKQILNSIRRDHGATNERHTKVALNSVLTDAEMVGAIGSNPVREIAPRRKKETERKNEGFAGPRGGSGSHTADNDR
ncbi:hypothetical protein [Mycolicibacterium wolinskyi]|uniref:hypothetical protein n=1 Tax=Mycolicibacterium wolinskyi TaxID=59750 RepID=UPI0039176A95